MKKKGIITVLALCLLLLGLAVPVQAEENIVSGSCGLYINWTLDRSTGVLEIEGTGPMTKAPWRSYSDDITSVVISTGITEIGDAAFQGCWYITSVSIPEGVTRIGVDAFRGASALPEVILPNSVTIIDENAFAYCNALKNIGFSKGLKQIGACAFVDCDNLKTVYLPDGVQKIGQGAFSECASLESVTMTDSVTEIEQGVFWRSFSLVSVRLSDNIEVLPISLFNGCEKLKYVNIPKATKTISYACFDSCNELSGVVLPEGVETIDLYAFYHTSIKEIIIPSSVTSIKGNAFMYNWGLRKLAICNPNAVIDDSAVTLGVVGTTAIYGYPESTAHYYAVEHGYAFKSLTTNQLWAPKLPAMDNVTMTSAVGHATGNIVSWEPVAGARLYQLFRRAADETSWTLVTNTGSTAYKDTSSTAGVKYYYKARARFYDFMGSMDIPAVSAIRPSSAALANVTITKAVGHSTGNILYWNAVSGAKIYQVYCLNNGTWTLLKNTGSLAYKDETAKAGVKCYYKIVARNGSNKSNIATTASACAIRPAAITLSDVVMDSAQGHSSGIIVRWNAVKNARLYQVYRLRAGTTNWELLTNTGSTAYKDTSARSGVRYYYKVVARNGDVKSSMNIASVSAVRP